MSTGRGVLSTRDQITNRLREDVFAGRLSAGERVSETSLAEQFGVSRGPIREALSLLTNEGLFVVKQNCGVTVAMPASPAVRGVILPIRRTLEVYAFTQIYDSLSATDFRFWEDVLSRMERACQHEDWQLIPQLDVEFHRYVLERADTPDLLAVWQTIVTRLRAHFWETVRIHHENHNLPRLHAHHAELLNAFRHGPKEAAIRALEAHIDEN